MSEEPVMEQNKAIFASQPKEKPQEQEGETLQPASQAIPEAVAVEKPIDTPIVEASAENLPVQTANIQGEEQQKAPVIDIPVPIIEPVKVEEPVSDASAAEKPVSSTPSILPVTQKQELPDVDSESTNGPESVLAPINKTESKKIMEETHPHHFCPHNFECLRKEFIIGFAIGLFLGFIGMKIISLLI